MTYEEAKRVGRSLRRKGWRHWGIPSTKDETMLNSDFSTRPITKEDKKADDWEVKGKP